MSQRSHCKPTFLGPLLSGIIASNPQNEGIIVWGHNNLETLSLLKLRESISFRVIAYWRHPFKRLATCAPQGLPHLPWPALGPWLGSEDAISIRLSHTFLS